MQKPLKKKITAFEKIFTSKREKKKKKRRESSKLNQKLRENV